MAQNCANSARETVKKVGLHCDAYQCIAVKPNEEIHREKKEARRSLKKCLSRIYLH